MKNTKSFILVGIVLAAICHVYTVQSMEKPAPATYKISTIRNDSSKPVAFRVQSDKKVSFNQVLNPQASFNYGQAVPQGEYIVLIYLAKKGANWTLKSRPDGQLGWVKDGKPMEKGIALSPSFSLRITEDNVELMPSEAPAAPAPMAAAAAAPEVVPAFVSQEEKGELFQAINAGDLDKLRALIAKKVDLRKPSKDSGHYPLSAATTADIPYAKKYAVFKMLLNAGASPDDIDYASGMRPLHYAAKIGSLAMVEEILKASALNPDALGGEKLRSPSSIAVQSHREGIITPSLARKYIASQKEFDKELPEAVKELQAKEQSRPTTDEVIAILKALRKALRVREGESMQGSFDKGGAFRGLDLAYIINNVLLVSDPERQELLKAIGARVTPEKREATMSEITDLIELVKKLNEKYPRNLIGTRVDMVVWALEAAKHDDRARSAFNKLRIAMALLAKVSEVTKDPVALEKIQKMLHDIALDYKKDAEGNEKEAGKI